MRCAGWWFSPRISESTLLSVGWLRDRRGHGELRLRYDRRAERRAGWLFGQLRARRIAALRSHRRLWAEWAAVSGLLLMVSAVAVRGHPQLRAGLLGGVATGMGGALLVGLMLVDGSLLPRLGRLAEEQVGDEFRGAAGVYGVVSNLAFDRSDVDHVVLAYAGVLAVEVKSLHGSRRELPPAVLSPMVEQARAGARRTAAVLRQFGVPLPVWPVLVLTGPGAPELPDTFRLVDGVTVVAGRTSHAWLPRLAAHRRLDRATTRQAADALLAYRSRRWEHDRQTRLPRQRRSAVRRLVP